METKNKNEEIQSRREFFKKAAKVALPVVGAIALANLPIANAEAQYGCLGCGQSCRGTCSGPCTAACARSCSGSCSGSCRGGVYY